MKPLLIGLGALLGVIVVLAGIYIWIQPRKPAPPAKFETTTDLEAYLRRLTDGQTPPGLSLAVVKDRDMVYLNAFGLAAPGMLAEEDSAYHWWSMTKIVSAYAALHLAENGQLDLQAPVSDYLPFFEMEAGLEPRVGDLINHSAGVGDATPAMIGWIHFTDDLPVNQTALLERIWPSYNTQKYAPGSQTHYSNLGYIVLGAVIEAASGMEFEQYVRETVLQPLGMAQTDFVYTPVMIPAAGSHPRYELQALLLPRLVNDMEALVAERMGGRLWFNTVYTDYTPSSGLIGPVTDASRFLNAYLNQGQLEGQTVLNAAVIEQMKTGGRILTDRNGYVAQGYGWQIGIRNASTYLEHRGGGPGFGTIMRLYPETGLGMVLMGNDTTVDYRILFDRMAEMDW